MMKYLLNGQESKRLWFRQVSELHVQEWLTFFENPITSQFWIANKDLPEIDCREWYRKQRTRYQNDLGGMNALINKITGKLVGHAGLLVQEVNGIQELEVAYSLVPEFWHQGYATEAAKKCKDYAFQNDFSPSLISIISLTNLPSEAVARKNGMVVDFETCYNENRVNIFRIQKDWWIQNR